MAASRLLKAGKSVVVIERGLTGDECAYWACVPSKTLLRAPEAQAAAGRAAGVAGTGLDWPATSDYRDYMIRHLDDKAQVSSYVSQGATVVKAEARLTGPGTLQAGDTVLHAQEIIIATGSEAVVPRLEGAGNVPVWTNRETFTATRLPGRAAVIGGSAVAVETATFLARFGVAVSLVHRGKTLMEREEPRVGELARFYLEEAGVDLRFGATARRARQDGTGSVVELDDGTSVATDVVIFATGRRPRSKDLGLETAGAKLDPRGAVEIEAQCRPGENLWAIGDVTAAMPFTHVARQQSRSLPFSAARGRQAMKASPGWSSVTLKSPPQDSPKPRPLNAGWPSPLLKWTWPKQSLGPLPTSGNHAGIWVCWRTQTTAS